MRPIILIVDDDALIRRALRRTLAGERYEVLDVGDGRAALAILEARPVEVLLADLCMPEMDGLDLLRRARTIRPNVVRVLMSGDGEAAACALHRGTAHHVLPKPWDSADLRVALERALPSGAPAGAVSTLRQLHERAEVVEPGAHVERPHAVESHATTDYFARRSAQDPPDLGIDRGAPGHLDDDRPGARREPAAVYRRLWSRCAFEVPRFGYRRSAAFLDVRPKHRAGPRPARSGPWRAAAYSAAVVIAVSTAASTAASLTATSLRAILPPARPVGRGVGRAARWRGVRVIEEPGDALLAPSPDARVHARLTLVSSIHRHRRRVRGGVAARAALAPAACRYGSWRRRRRPNIVRGGRAAPRRP